MAYLDSTGLAYLWGKIKARIPTKTSQLTNDSGFSASKLFANKTVAVSTWTADTSVDGFWYRADILCAGVNADMAAAVTFSAADVESGNYAPICNTGAGAVTIYATFVPENAITVPTILVVG